MASGLSLTERLDQAHRMSVSDPSRQTIFSEARDEIKRLATLLRSVTADPSIEEFVARGRAIEALLKAGHTYEELADKPTWRLIIMKNTDPTLFDDVEGDNQKEQE